MLWVIGLTPPISARRHKKAHLVTPLSPAVLAPIDCAHPAMRLPFPFVRVPALLVLLAVAFTPRLAAGAAEAKPCPFCEIIAGTRQPEGVVYRDDKCLAFLSLDQRNPGHLLVVPLVHADNFLEIPADTMHAMTDAAHKLVDAIKRTDLKCEGFQLAMNSGSAAGQTVFHAHLHLIPRFAGEPPQQPGEHAASDGDLAPVAKKIRDALAVAPPSPASPAPEDRYVTVNGAKLFYWTEGHGEPLLVIEGGPGAAGYLDPFFHELADRFAVIHFRGLGRAKSDLAAKASDYSFSRDIEDIEGFRRALGLDSFNLFGHSYGGMLVIGYTLAHPAAVKRLVISNGLFSAEGWQQGDDNVNSQIRYQYPEVWEKLTALRARGLRSNSPEVQALMQQVSEAIFYVANVTNVGKTSADFNPEVCYAIVGADADFQIGGSIAGLDFSSRLHELKMPVLITTSRFDRVVPPAHTFKFKTYAPQAEFVVFEKSGHNLFLEEHEKFVATLRTFLTKPVAPAAQP